MGYDHSMHLKAKAAAVTRAEEKLILARNT